MKIRTSEQFLDKASEEIVWRKKEILVLKGVIESLNDNSGHKTSMLCRSGVALLYAHWEGFVKKSGGFSLEYISMQRHEIKDLKPNFITLILKTKIDQFSDSKKYSVFDGMVETLLKHPNSQLNVPHKNIVNTQSNLSSTVLKEITWCLGIDYSHFSTKEVLIDRMLLAKRNHIAHGEESTVGKDDFIELADEVLGLLETFRNLIENSVVEKSYLYNS